MKLPSVKTLSAITDKSLALRAMLERYRDGKSTLQQVMDFVDALISGHGVEYIRHKKDTMRQAFGITYVNMGDPYIPTLMFVHALGTFHVGSWGTFIEKDSDNYE